jgi:hypothetical protein
MTLIKDVQHDVRDLDFSGKSLRKFGYMVGMIATLIGMLLILIHGGAEWLKIFCLSFGGLLIVLGLMAPLRLRWVYLIWMTMAFVVGWFISRVILFILFYCIITSIGVIARLFRKEFLDIPFRDGKKSYWIEKKKRETPEYEKLY